LQLAWFLQPYRWTAVSSRVRSSIRTRLHVQYISSLQVELACSYLKDLAGGTESCIWSKMDKSGVLEGMYVPSNS